MTETQLRMVVALVTGLLASLGGAGTAILATGESLGAARATSAYWERYAGELKTEVLECRAR